MYISFPLSLHSEELVQNVDVNNVIVLFHNLKESVLTVFYN